MSKIGLWSVKHVWMSHGTFVNESWQRLVTQFVTNMTRLCTQSTVWSSTAQVLRHDRNSTVICHAHMNPQFVTKMTRLCTQSTVGLLRHKFCVTPEIALWSVTHIWISHGTYVSESWQRLVTLFVTNKAQLTRLCTQSTRGLLFVTNCVHSRVMFVTSSLWQTRRNCVHSLLLWSCASQFFFFFCVASEIWICDMSRTYEVLCVTGVSAVSRAKYECDVLRMQNAFSCFVWDIFCDICVIDSVWKYKYNERNMNVMSHAHMN